MPPRALAFALVLLAFALPAAAVQTVCTITVNSSDEGNAFRRHLPRDKYRFVELVERGRPDWLASACERQVQCDVLVVSGHFAGIDFYSDKVDVAEYLPVEEMERAACSQSCPALFSKLREVYLFGCDSLNPDDHRIASPTQGESNRDHMRRIFAGVPVIYGFAGPAPLGPTSGSLLERAFREGMGVDIARGRPSAKLLSAFSRNRLVSTRGVEPGEPLAARGRQVCGFLDERITPAARVAFAHELLARDVSQASTFLARLETTFALDDVERASPETAAALASVAADSATRARFIDLARRTTDPATRARLLDVAHAAGWLSAPDLNVERVRLAGELVARDAVGPSEVGLVCALNADHSLDGERHRIEAPAVGRRKVAHAAVYACLGDPDAQSQVLAALSAGDEREVGIAQAYLRERPVTDAASQRHLAAGIAAMPGSEAQVRALDALGRLRLSDAQALESLSRAYATTRSVNVQRAIAEVFLRADKLSLPRSTLADAFKRHRLASSRGDLIDVLLRNLGSDPN